MNQQKLILIEKLINNKKIDEAQLELSKLGRDYDQDAYYLYLRAIKLTLIVMGSTLIVHLHY